GGAGDRARAGRRLQGQRTAAARHRGGKAMSEVLTAPHSGTSEARRPVLQVVNGSKIYGGVHAIEGVDFDLFPGEIHALVGENGAGKSTLCKAIAGAIRLTSGTYCV